MCERKMVLAITGASGVAYAVRLLEVLTASEWDVHLIISNTAYIVLAKEMGIMLNPNEFDPCAFGLSRNCVSELFPSGQIHFHRNDDFTASIASGSYPTDAMVVCPCTMGTLGCIASGMNLNLIHRAADVHLKEHRKLILVPRETPLSLIHLENMAKVTRAGGIILPAMPAFYHGVNSLQDVVNFVVSRICDQLGVDNQLIRRWKLQGTEETSYPLDEEMFVEMPG